MTCDLRFAPAGINAIIGSNDNDGSLIEPQDP